MILPVMRLSEILAAVRKLAPESLAESWDRVGLHVGDERRQVRRALLCIDLTEAVMAEAVRFRANLVIAYHPPIFDPLTHLRPDTWKTRIMLEATRRHIAVYSPHTALDAVGGGVNDWLAEGVGPGQVAAIRSASRGESWSKVTTFVPVARVEALRAAMAAAGAGAMGNYTHCSFSVEGEGTFKGSTQSRPAIGRPGRLERVVEKRLEMICPTERAGAVVSALRETHPYEEPALDICRLEDSSMPAAAPMGQGRVVTLTRPVALPRLVERIRRHLRGKAIRMARPSVRKAIRRVGLCAGAGGSLLPDAGPIDAFVTGEMRHHDVLDATEQGIAVLLAGHCETERPYLRIFRKRLQQVCPGVTWHVSRMDRPLLKPA